MDLDTARKLVLILKQSHTSHGGYGLQNECEALVGHILQNMLRSSLPTLVPETKNEEDSISYREEGNQHFVVGDDTEAIKYYTMSLAYANDNELMSYAHANRSAALYRKQLFKECLIDIDTALDLGYPEEKRKRLKERGVKAMDEIKKKLKIRKDESIDPEKLMSMCLSEKITEEPITVKFRNGKAGNQDACKNGHVNGNEENPVNGSSTTPSNEKKESRYLADEGPLKLAYGASKEVPAVSDGVRIAYNEKYGRHLEATKEFKPGDIVSFEDPYAHIIYTQK